MTACPSPDRLAAFIAGRMTADVGGALEAHIDTCEGCRRGLAALVRDRTPRGHLGRYRVDGLLGGGGMGIVYRGFDPELRRAVAIKVVRPGDGGDALRLRARLAREATDLAALDHRHVCQVHDIGTDGDELWMAMELVDGVSMRRWLADAPPIAERVRVLADVADALAAAHAAGLCHRDVKPDNVMIARDGRAVLTDFGLAGRLDGGHASVLAGTPAYLAPELLDGAPADATADQYAFAVMAHEALHGSRPRPRHEPARSLSAPMRRLLGRALADDPRARYPTMRTLAHDLRAGQTRRPGWLVLAAVATAAAAIALALVATRTSSTTHDPAAAVPAAGASVPEALAAVPAAAVPAAGASVPEALAAVPAAAVPAAAVPAAAAAVPQGAAEPRPMPPGVRTLPGPPDLRRVDVDAFWRRASEEVPSEHPGARLARYYAVLVDERGYTNATNGGMIEAIFAFVDPDPDAPCGVERMVLSSGALETDLTPPGCLPPVAPPRCTLLQVLARAASLGISHARRAMVAYDRRDPAGPRWYVAVDRDEVVLRDDCAPR